MADLLDSHEELEVLLSQTIKTGSVGELQRVLTHWRSVSDPEERPSEETLQDFQTEVCARGDPELFSHFLEITGLGLCSCIGYYAISTGNPAIIEIMRAKGWDINAAPDWIGDPHPPLTHVVNHVAKNNSNDASKAFLEWFLEKGADPNGQNIDQNINYLCNPLNCAASGCSIEIVRILLEAGATLPGSDALFEAAATSVRGDHEGIEMMEYLIEHGADVNELRKRPLGQKKLGKGQPGGPLHAAIMKGKAQRVSFLLEKGANKNLKPPGSGRTPIELAIVLKRSEIVEILEAYDG